MNQNDEVDGIKHNTQAWQVCTNRHRSCSGNEWGWIEGAPGNEMWSDDGSRRTHKDANRIVAEHNAWLERQKPVRLRLIEATAQRDRRKREADDAFISYNRALVALAEADTKVVVLQNEAAGVNDLNQTPGAVA